MSTWDERYRTGAYQPPPGPSPVLEAKLEDMPTGRALDVATGTGRNAIYLAEHGYTVDAIDTSAEALERARKTAAERGVEVTWRQADVADVEFPVDHYAVITLGFFRGEDRLTAIKQALQPGGVLVHEHHLRTTDQVDRGPDDDRYRFAANELLRTHLDLTILYYEEGIREAGGKRSAVATLLGRKSYGAAQSYPRALLGYEPPD